MARPIKQTVDYFPHLVNKGKTKLILQNEFGNDGYAFWYQLLELLCLTDKQVYDYNNPASWRLLLAETHVTEDNATKILQLLADLEAIDSKLHENKIIWSQNLVENLELVYKRRATGTPTKPVTTNNNPINVNNNRQTRQDKTRQDKTRDIPAKKKYGEFNNVLLSEDEYAKLEGQFNNNLPAMIETLSIGIESKGYKYKSHYATILAWDKRDRKEVRDGTNRGNTSSRRLPQTYRTPDEIFRDKDA